MAFLVSLSSCSKNNEPATGAVTDTQPTLSPTSNFYQWVNNDWLKNTPIPADKPGVNNFIQIQKQVDEELKELLASLDQKTDKTPQEEKISVLYDSYMDMGKRDALGLSPLKSDLQRIDAAKNYDDIAVSFTHLQNLGVDSPLVYVASTDYKDSNKVIVFVSQAGLGLEREDYLGDDERTATIRKQYQDVIQKLFELASMENAAEQAESVLKLEGGLAKMQWSKAQNRDPQRTYNVTAFDGLKSQIRNVDVTGQLSELGMPTKYPFNVMQPSYLEAFNNFFVSQDMQSWKAYLKARLLLSYGKLLDQRFKDAIVNYEIGRGLYDVEEPMADQAVHYLDDSVGMLLGHIYVEDAFDENMRETLQGIIKSIVDSYRVAINESPRMTSATKSKAIEKLDKMKFRIGYPDKWQDYSSLEPAPGTLVENHMRIQRYENKRNIGKLSKPVDKDEWEMPPQTVNAYYVPTKNIFVLLAGILHEPFFSTDGTDAEHYGGIGFVIGHEIGHGFDDQGSRFDGDGNLVNWWSKEDTEAYNKIKNALIAQADNYEILPGKFLNGELEIGEIMGDASGAEISLRAFQNIITSKHLDPDQGYRDFFIQLAKTWRDKLRPDFQLLILDKDPHPPSEFRANGIVRNFDEFHTVFKTKPGDAMYMPIDERIHIWGQGT